MFFFPFFFQPFFSGVFLGYWLGRHLSHPKTPFRSAWRKRARPAIRLRSGLSDISAPSTTSSINSQWMTKIFITKSQVIIFIIKFFRSAFHFLFCSSPQKPTNDALCPTNIKENVSNLQSTQSVLIQDFCRESKHALNTWVVCKRWGVTCLS